MGMPFQDLIRALLNPDPAARYTVEEALDHPWFTGVVDVRRCGVGVAAVYAGLCVRMDVYFCMCVCFGASLCVRGDVRICMSVDFYVLVFYPCENVYVCAYAC